MFHFKLSMLGRLRKPVELSQNWLLSNFKYKQPDLYAIIFDQYEEVPFEVPPGHTNVYVVIKSVPVIPKLYAFFVKKE